MTPETALEVAPIPLPAPAKGSASEALARLTEVQQACLADCDPDDISRFHYHPFKGQSHGLFQVAPGWQRMELSARGVAVRNLILQEIAHAG